MRRAVASDTGTPADILGRLANDKSVEVRRAAAGNPTTPHDALERLARSEDLATLDALAKNRGAGDVARDARHRVEAILGEPRLLSDDEIRRIEEQTRRLRS